MAVCNRFTEFKKASGNFMLFSQYAEDITHNHTEGENWKVSPSKFVALNIDYSKLTELANPDGEDLNTAIPKYFQNYFENGCAYIRNNEDLLKSVETIGKYTAWNSEISRNLFWNSLFANWKYYKTNDDPEEYEYILSDEVDNSLLTIEKTIINKEECYIVPQIKYWGDINMQSYNEYNGMGYNDLYCYIPADSFKYKCVVEKTITDGNVYLDNDATYLEGHSKDKLPVGNYPTYYYFDKNISFSFDNPNLNIDQQSSDDTFYNINTIVVLYDILALQNDEWVSLYENIPMGMYIAGMFENGELTNPIKKYVNTSYGIGTSYGLRICTRFTVTPNEGVLHETEMHTNSDDYASLTELMTSMSECVDSVLKMTASNINNSQQYKDLYAMVKNNRTNVPYVKSINGTDYWFVNGRLIGPVTNVIINDGSEGDDHTHNFATDEDVDYTLETGKIPEFDDSDNTDDCDLEYASDDEVMEHFFG